MATEKQIESLITKAQAKKQAFKVKKWHKFFFDREIIHSKAFWSLRTATAIKVLLIFHNKCKMERPQGSKAKSKNDFIIVNNGEIQFSYRDAKTNFGISAYAFRDAIDALVGAGFINITKAGSGQHRHCSLYAISKRWQDYGTADFTKEKRPKDKQHYGFQRKER